MDQARTANSDHPNFGRLVGLVCEAVLEVVCVSGLGYIAARRGLFTANVQKNVANLNIFFFTPCLSKYILLGTLRCANSADSEQFSANYPPS